MIGHPRAVTCRSTWSPARALKLATAVVVLNGLLTFHNHWPSLWPRPAPELSLELAVLLACLVLAAAFLGPPRGRWLAAITAALAFLVLGRYFDVTADGLFGRTLDLYWDLPHVPAVVAMATDGEPAWRLGLICSAVLLVLSAIVASIFLAVQEIASGLANRTARRAVGLLSAGLIGAYAAGMSSDRLGIERWFATPVLHVYADQGTALVRGLRRGTQSPQRSAVPEADLDSLAGADVFVFFVESYGATLFEKEQLRRRFAPRLAAHDDMLSRAHWHSASALVDSPTFGGGSWLAHASFLSGRWIDEQATYQEFLRHRPSTLTTRFSAAGYRTVALMPGIKRAWPEGAGLGFDEIYTAASLGYQGPPFGWWMIPDQYSLAVLQKKELERPQRAPLFVFFPTIASHMPFHPNPPYQSDWSSATDASSYSTPPDALTLSEALDQIDSLYLDAVDRSLQVLIGFLRERIGSRAVVIIVGDHQPPAIVAGPGASRRVPVHVLSRQADDLQPYLGLGFGKGLSPAPGTLFGLEQLGSRTLQAFSGSTSRRVLAPGP